MTKRSWIGRLHELSFGQRLIHVLLTFGLISVCVEFFFADRSDIWPVDLLIVTFGAVIGSIVFAILEHVFFKLIPNRKDKKQKNQIP